MKDIDSSPPGSAPISVLIADDHGLVRAGLRAMLSGEPDMVVVGEAADGVQALDLALSLRPTVVLADISMPPPDGIEVARQLRSEQGCCRTLIVSMHEDELMLRDALSAGAAGYLIKRAIESELTRAIRMVAAGQQYIHEQMQRYLAPDTCGPVKPETPRSGPADLDEDEAKLLQLLAKGATMKRVAQALGVTDQEAEDNRKGIMTRLGLVNRIDVIRFIETHGLSEDET